MKTLERIIPLLCLILSLSWSISADDFGPISIEVVPPMGNTNNIKNYYIRDFRIANKSSKNTEISLKLTLISYSKKMDIIRNLIVPANSVTTASMYCPLSSLYIYEAKLELHIDREKQKHNLNFLLNTSHNYNQPDSLFSPELPLEDLKKLLIVPSSSITTTFPLAQWGKNIKYYYGFKNIFLAATDQLTPEIKSSIYNWVLLGGNLFFIIAPEDIWPEDIPNEKDDYYAHKFGLGEIIYARPITSTNKSKYETLKKKCSYTNIKLSKEEVGILGNETFAMMNKIQNSKPKYEDYFYHLELIESETIPILSICGIMLIFIIIIGPVNFLIFKNNKKRAWILVSTPIISLVFCVAIILFITIKEGWFSRGTAIGITLLDQTNNKVITKARVAIYSPLIPRQDFRFDNDDCLYIENSGSVLLNLNNGQHFSANLLKPRIPLRYSIDKIETRLERLQVQKTNNNQMNITNGLGCSLSNLIVIGEDKNLYESTAIIPAGDSISLTKSNQITSKTIFEASDTIDLCAKLIMEHDINLALSLARTLPPGYYVAIANQPMFFSTGITPEQFKVTQYIIGKYDNIGEIKNEN